MAVILVLYLQYPGVRPEPLDPVTRLLVLVVVVVVVLEVKASEGKNSYGSVTTLANLFRL